MPFAVELYFDEQVASAVAGLQERLEGLGPGLSLRTLGFEPHISLLTCADVDEDGVRAGLREVARRNGPLHVSLESAGAFPPDASTLFLVPAASPALVAIHRSVWACLADVTTAPNAYYSPKRWVPHCTVAQGVPPAERARALAVMVATGLPLQGRLVSVGLTGYRPAVCRFRFPLTG